ncbi:hypothetical protein pipiens_020457, partial [Culex pipiens pipiens]
RQLRRIRHQPGHIQVRWQGRGHQADQGTLQQQQGRGHDRGRHDRSGSVSTGRSLHWLRRKRRPGRGPEARHLLRDQLCRHSV